MTLSRKKYKKIEVLRGFDASIGRRQYGVMGTRQNGLLDFDVGHTKAKAERIKKKWSMRLI